MAPAPESTIERVFFLKEVPADVKSGDVKKASLTLKVQWVPFDFEPEA